MLVGEPQLVELLQLTAAEAAARLLAGLDPDQVLVDLRGSRRTTTSAGRRAVTGARDKIPQLYHRYIITTQSNEADYDYVNSYYDQF